MISCGPTSKPSSDGRYRGDIARCRGDIGEISCGPSSKPSREAGTRACGRSIVRTWFGSGIRVRVRVWVWVRVRVRVKADRAHLVRVRGRAKG